MSSIKDQLGVIILVFVFMVLMACLWVFRTDHDIVLSMNQWIAGVIGGILTLVTGKVAHATQSNTISDSKVSQVVEAEPSK